MKTICLILALLVISQCQEQVLENWVTANAGFSKAFEKPAYDWSNIYDFAVYGWFKIDGSQVLPSQSVLFHFTQNTNGHLTVNTKVGDYVLGIFYQDKKLTIGTYAYPSLPYYKATYNVRAQDVGKWAYFYVGYSGSLKKLHYRFEFGSYSAWGSFTGVQHSLSAYHKLFVGYQQGYSKFPGQISKVNIHAGAGAYTETNFVKPFNPYQYTCPVVWDQCDFKGNSYTICNNNSYVPWQFPIKSIFLPAGYFMGIQITDYVIPIDTTTACLSYNTVDSTRHVSVTKN